MSDTRSVAFDRDAIAAIRANHDAALALVKEGVRALLAGDYRAAEDALSRIDIATLRLEQRWLKQVGLSGAAPAGLAMPVPNRAGVSEHLKRIVTARDGFCWQFTGLRLIDPDIFRALGALTATVSWHPHYAKRDTAKGRAAHPITRTHAAAFEQDPQLDPPFAWSM